MNAAPTGEIQSILCALEGWELPHDFEMPTQEDLENDLALGNPGWKSLLRPSPGPEDRVTPGRTQSLIKQWSHRLTNVLGGGNGPGLW